MNLNFSVKLLKIRNVENRLVKELLNRNLLKNRKFLKYSKPPVFNSFHNYRFIDSYMFVVMR